MDFGGGKNHHDLKLMKGVGRVEPRRLGLGLVAAFLLVTFAYFSTARLDTVRIAMMSAPPGNAAAAVSSSSVDLGVRNAQDGVLVEGDESISSVQSDLVGHDAALEQDIKDEVFVASEEPTNSTQLSGVLEDEELQVQDAVPASKNTSPVLVPSHPSPVPVPVPVQQISPPEVKQPEVTPTPKNSSPIVAPSDPSPAPVPVPVPVPVRQISPPEVKRPEVRREDSKRAQWKPLCDRTSNFRIDWCELEGDVRVVGKNSSIMLVASPESDNRSFREETWRIKPYPRKADPAAMRNVREMTVRSLATAASAPQCTDRHDVPALVFSDRGYTGNYFHAYTDVILPLFLTSRQYAGEVQFLVADFQMWWLGKFLPVFRNLSRYDMIDIDNDDRVRCFPRVQVGLTSHDDFSIDPRRAPNGYSMVDFARFLRGTYGLPKDVATGIKPRLLVIARARTRRFANLDEIIRGAQKVGFEVEVSEGQGEVAEFARVVNQCDVLLGVHGAGLTNMVFLPERAVVIQVVPLGGLEFVAGYFRGPSRDLGLRYIEYSIAAGESTLVDQYPPGHAVFTDPAAIRSRGWVALKEAFLDKQDVRLDMRRFRPVLKKALGYLRKNQ